ncbi:MAG: hypothetical protein WAM71_15430 [Candidatus Korobacteraceae bacterium]
MAATKSRSSSTFSRRVAPFAPLALALAVGAASPGGPSSTVTAVSSPSATVAGVKAGDLQVEQCEDVQDSAECHAKYRSGCNNSSQSYDTYLNYVKNTIDFSGAAQPASFWNTLEQFQAKEQQLQALEQKQGVKLGTGNHNSFAEPLKNLGEGSLQGALGYLYAITPETGGTGETSNCKLTQSESDVDFHIFIGFDSNRAAEILTSPNSAKLADKAKSIVVEMTPHYRAAFQPNWTSEVVKSVRGRKVKVVGQLMVDNDHNDTKDDCGVIGATSNCWRATVWELHPVTMFQVCMAADNNCDVNSSNWVDLEKLSQGSAGTPGRTPRNNEPGGSAGSF